jgi:hypothetical protein
MSKLANMKYILLIAFLLLDLVQAKGKPNNRILKIEELNQDTKDNFMCEKWMHHWGFGRSG